MADSVEINIKDLAQTQQKLYDFSAKLGDRVTLLALRAGANYMLKNIRQAEPVKTGRLRRATVVKNSRIHQRRRNGQVGVYITVKAGKTRKDEKGAFYAQFVERGYKRGKTLVPGRKFVKSTFEANKVQAAEIVLQSLELAGERLAQLL